MALQTVNGLWLPQPLSWFIPGNTNFLIDAASEKVAFVFKAPKTGTLESVSFSLGTVTTGDTLKVSFQDIDIATGNPDGVVDQYRTVVVADTDDGVTKDTGILSSDGTDTGTKRSVTAGDYLAIVIEYNARVGGVLNIVGALLGVETDAMIGATYVTHYTTSWAKNTTTLPRFALKYNDGSYPYMPIGFPITAIGPTVTINTETSPDEAALKFRVPAPIQVIGAWFIGDLDGDADVVLYDDAGSVVASASLDKDIRMVTSRVPFSVLFNAPATLSKNAWYYLSLKPTTTTSVILNYFTVSVKTKLDQMDGGQDFHYATRTDVGAWTASTIVRPLMGLIINGIDDGVGGGGGILKPPLLGGGLEL
mgnify:CR=1 FL=1